MNELQAHLRKIIAKVLVCRESDLTDDSGLSTHPGWDSLHHVLIIVEIEHYYCIKVRDEEIEQLRDFKSLYQYLTLKLSKIDE